MNRFVTLLSVLFLPAVMSAQIQQSGYVATPSASTSILGQTTVAMTNATCNVVTPGSNCTVSGLSTSYLAAYVQDYYLTGTLSGTQSLVIPLQPGGYHCVGNSTNQAITVGGASGTTVSVPAGVTQCVISHDGANYVSASGLALNIQTNGVDNSSQTTLNSITSTTNATGLTLTPSNPSGGIEQYEAAGTVNTAHGGTGADLSAATGVLQDAAGTISASTALANGTTATTQTAGDATTKVATDAFVGAAVTANNPMTTLGDVIYGGASGTPMRLPGNTTNLLDFYCSQGNGSTALAPSLCPALTPTLIAGYTTYVPFTEGTGTVARDTSGNANDCTFAGGGAAPTWISSGAIVQGIQLGNVNATGGAIKYCSFPASASFSDTTLSNARTIYACGYLQPYTKQGTGNGVLSYSVILGGNSGTVWNWWQSAGINGGQFTSRLNGYMGMYGGLGGVLTGTTQPSIGQHCWTVTLGHNTDSTFDKFYIDGKEVANYTSQGRSWDARVIGTAYNVGYLPWNTTIGFWPGNVSTILAYPTYQTPAQVFNNASALNFLAFTNRGIIPAPPAQSTTHANIIIADGDSLTNGTPNVVTPWPSILNTGTATLNTAFTVTNNGFAGTLVYDDVANTPLTEAVQFSPFANFAIQTEAAGINDLNVGGFGPSGVSQARIASAKTAKGLGYQVLMPTMIDSGNTQSGNVETINATLRAYAEQNPGLYTLVDWANEPCLGASGANANPGALGCFTQSTGAESENSVTNCQLTSNVVTLTVPNNFVAGDQIWFYVASGACVPINNAASTVPFYTVSASGLSSSQIQFSLTHANIVSTAVSGASVCTIFQCGAAGAGLHPTGSGENEMARLYANVVNYITGSTAASPTIVSTATHTTTAGERFTSATGAVPQAFTLPVCYGYSTTTPFYYINNAGGNAVTVQPPAGFNLNGSSSAVSVPLNATMAFYANILSSTTSGCGWYTRSGDGPTSVVAPSALTTNTIPKATGAATLGNSSVTDNGTTVDTAESIRITTASNPILIWAPSGSASGGLQLTGAHQFDLGNGTLGDTSGILSLAQINVSGAAVLGAGSTAPTQAANDNSTKLATTAYVDGLILKTTISGVTAPATIATCSGGVSTMTGLTSAMAISVSADSNPGSGIIYSAYYNGAGSVGYNICNIAGSTPNTVNLNFSAH